MSNPPAFLSFPDLPQLGSGSKGESSKPPSFASFPDLPELSGSKAPRERSREEKREREREHGQDRSKRGDHKHRDSERERDRHRSKHSSSRDEDSHRDRRSKHSRDHDSRSKRDDRDREREREDERDARRRDKERRRARERDEAEALARGEAKSGGRKEVEKYVQSEQGVPWYEIGKKVARYEDDVDPTSAKASFVDVVGDKDAVRYGLTTSHSAPRYRRDDVRVLGLPTGLRVVYSRERTEKGVEIAPAGKPYIPRHIFRPESAQHIRILLRPSDGSLDLTSSFTPFERPAPREEPDYRSISHDVEPDSDSEFLRSLGPASTAETQLLARTAEFERHLRSTPTDVPSWLTYSKLHTLTPVPTRAESEVTLSILARALEVAQNFASPELHLAYLAAAEAFWPPAKVTERWRNVLRELAQAGAAEVGMMRLWLGYIEWREGQGLGAGKGGEGGGGGVDEVIDVYIECLDKLASDEIVSDPQAREENQVYLFLRACLFLRQAGYTERAVATFQALIEVTFFKPAHLRPPLPPFDRKPWFEGVLEEFEDHWDSESPRIGEDGATGWQKTHADPNPPPAPAPVQLSTPAPTPDPFLRWHEAEQRADTTYSRPGRASDLDAPEDDPFHVILFSDLSPFLFTLLTPSARLQLVYAFLNFLGLPFVPAETTTSSAAAADAHLCWTIGSNDAVRARFWPAKLHRRIAWQTVGGEPMEPEQARLASPFACPVKSWVPERATLLAKPGSWFRDLDAVDLDHVDVPFARNALAMLRPLIPDPTFVLCTFAFEAALSTKSAVKLAKTILSGDRDNLALWDGYARLERSRGNTAAARQVYVTALQAAHERQAASADPDAEMDEDELWASWVEMEWEEDEARCLDVLVMAASRGNPAPAADPSYVPTPPAPIAMLKAKQYYSAPLLPLSLSRRALAATFTALSSITSARTLLLSLISSLPPSHPQAEETYQLLLRLLFTHISRHKDHPRSLVRDVLESATKAFPNNTQALGMYLYTEAGGRVYGRIQRLVDDLTKEGAGVNATLWAVWAESQSSRSFWDGGAERVRRVLDRSVNSASGKHSVALWKLYIELESALGRYTVAKALLYRAINSVGGCKDLYMLPFTAQLRPHFTPRELADMVALMDERGIRVRVPTDGFWDEADLDPVEEEEEEVGDDEYGFLRDREVAKPY